MSCDESSAKKDATSSPSSKIGPPKQAKSSRTPYSTFKMSEKDPSLPIATSDGNTLKFTPPGFRNELAIKFPDGRLAVCTACKTNFKTRQACRVSNGHTCAPWSTAYVCITLDETCTDEAGRYVEDVLVAEMAPWKAYDMVHAIDLGTPVCASCKKINHARKFCRERHRHRQLPWSTVYVTLSAKKRKKLSKTTMTRHPPTTHHRLGLYTRKSSGPACSRASTLRRRPRRCPLHRATALTRPRASPTQTISTTYPHRAPSWSAYPRNPSAWSGSTLRSQTRTSRQSRGKGRVPHPATSILALCVRLPSR